MWAAQPWGQGPPLCSELFCLIPKPHTLSHCTTRLPPGASWLQWLQRSGTYRDGLQAFSCEKFNTNTTLSQGLLPRRWANRAHRVGRGQSRLLKGFKRGETQDLGLLAWRVSGVSGSTASPFLPAQTCNKYEAFYNDSWLQSHPFVPRLPRQTLWGFFIELPVSAWIDTNILTSTFAWIISCKNLSFPASSPKEPFLREGLLSLYSYCALVTTQSVCVSVL